MYVDGIVDARSALYAAFFSQDKATKVQEFATTKLPFYLEKYEGFLKKSGVNYLVGGKLSWAGTKYASIHYLDVIAFEFLESIESLNDLANFPVLKAFKAGIAAQPSIAAYLANPERPKPFGK